MTWIFHTFSSFNHIILAVTSRCPRLHLIKANRSFQLTIKDSFYVNVWIRLLSSEDIIKLVSWSHDKRIPEIHRQTTFLLFYPCTVKSFYIFPLMVSLIILRNTYFFYLKFSLHLSSLHKSSSHFLRLGIERRSITEPLGLVLVLF